MSMQRDTPLPRIQSAKGWAGAEGAGTPLRPEVSGGETHDEGCRGCPCRTGFSHTSGKIPKCALPHFVPAGWFVGWQVLSPAPSRRRCKNMVRGIQTSSYDSSDSAGEI